jgi:two-component system chemotaxis response regulator CheB
MINRRIRVLIVDDSAIVRKVLTDQLSADPEIEVVGTAIDPYVARDKILQLHPDIITLDIEMPRMDGLSFLKLIMLHRPMPVIIISSLTTSGSSKALEALQFGAVDIMAKPSGSYSAASDGTELRTKVKAAFQAKIRKRTGETVFITKPPPPAATHFGARPTGSSPVLPVTTSPPPRAHTGPERNFSHKQLILIGASTGGTEALKAVLTNLSPNLPGICIVQHIPAHFSRAFADRLNSQCALEVREAKNGDKVQPGLALIAPGGFHMLLRKTAAGYIVELNEGPMVHHQRPAVDVLFDSAVRAGAAPHSLAMILTGMGADGAAGMLKLKDAGATTVAQDEASCVVFGMPREAIRMGAAQKVLPLDQMHFCIERYATDVAVAGSAVGP